MESILKDLQDVRWWFTTVFIGLLMGLAAAYGRDAIDRLLGGLFESRRAANQREEERREARIAQLIGNGGSLVLAMHREMRHRLEGFRLTITGLAVTFPSALSIGLADALLGRVNSMVFTLIGVGFIVWGNFRFIDAHRLAYEIDEAHDREPEPEESSASSD